MCGINGFNFVDKKIISKMNDSLKHRGPDAEGAFIDKKVSLGHRRLSIIDISQKGNQPMQYKHKNKSVIIVFNGEIYNFKEIKKNLLTKGYKFKSETDTEVILASYLEWGDKCVNHFNGMWAFCIYDPENMKFFLSRDRLGKKPLYYFFDKKKFIFSSEIKGILEHKPILKINKDAVDLYLSLGFIPAPYSIYEQIYKLEANTNLIFDLKSKKIEKSNYWKLPHYSPIYDKKKLLKEFNFLLEDSTKLRMIADVPLGAFLSGGLDSSTIVKEMMNIQGSKRLTTYSLGFKQGNDETNLINILVDNFKVKNYHNYFEEAQFKKILKEIYYYYDEPFADTSMFPSFYISSKARESLTVCLSGDGGDELFGGYGPHKIAAQLNVLKKIPAPFRNFLLKTLPGIKKFDQLRKGIYLSLLTPSEIRSKARGEDYVPDIFKKVTQKNFKQALELANNDLVEAFINYDRYFKTMGDNYLCKVDRASMANSLEVRSPFLDYRFLEFASKIPSRWKTNGFVNKIILREAVKDRLPKKILKAKKSGFTPPIHIWINEKENKKEMEKAIEVLSSKKIISNEWGVFLLKTLLEEGKEEYKIRIWLFYKWYLFWGKFNHLK